MKRWLLIGSIAIVAILGVSLFLFLTSLDSIIKNAVEKYGTEITQAPVRLKRVGLNLKDGQGGLYGFNVGVPKGFRSDSTFRFDEIKIDVDEKSIGKDAIVINEIRIEKPIVTYELGLLKSNVQAIGDNAESYAGPSPDKSEAKKEETSDGPKLIIDNVYINGGQVIVNTTLIKDQVLTAALPDIHLKGIGKTKGGATPGDIAKILLRALTKNVGIAVSTIDLGDLRKAVAEEGRALVDEGTAAAKETISEVSEALPDEVGEELGDAAGDAGNALKGLLKKD